MFPMKRLRISGRFSALAVALCLASAGCDHEENLPSVGSALPTAAPAASPAPAALANQPPVPAFAIDPQPDGNGVVRAIAKAPGSFLVHFNMCNTSDPEGDKLLFVFDFVGDGSQMRVGSTGNECRQDYVYAHAATWVETVNARTCVVDLDEKGQERREQECRTYTVRLAPACPNGGVCTVFRTYAPTFPTFGGVTGADRICQARASAVQLPGTYKAWISDASGSPSTRFARSKGPYQMPNGVTVAEDWADLTDGSLAAAILITEYGEIGFTPDLVWTNTLADGTAGGEVPGDDCQGWTSFSGGGNGGFPGYTDAGWTDLTGKGRGPQSCGAIARVLYCFQQG
jgi:hypothetical protein